MRGKATFKNETENIATPRIKGRNLGKLARRNECLADRYHYYCNYTDKRFEVVIEQLSFEFFLSNETINDIIRSQGPYLHVLKKEKPSLYYFQNKWPHLKWKS